MKNNLLAMNELRFRFALPIFLLAAFLFATGAHVAGRRSRVVSPGQAPEVVVKRDRSSPLEILRVGSEAASAITPQLNLLIRNASTKPITAYAIRYDVITGRSRTGGVELSVAALPRAILQPGQSTQTDVGGGENHSDGISKIEVSVDFVEFDDGSRWGPDTKHSAERLAGQRAGARAAAQHLLRILATQGANAVVEAVDAETLDLRHEADRSPQWLDGFTSGIAYTQERIRQAYREGGVSSIESVLRQPIDASDTRKVK